MTPAALMNLCRQRYNASSDTFYSDDEIYDYIEEAETQLARETYCIEGTHTDTSVASTRNYPFSGFTTGDYILAIKRVEYDGTKLMKTTFREDDSITLSSSTITSLGTPEYWYEWDDTLYLRNTPDAAKTITIYAYDLPSDVSATGTLDVPTAYHMDLSLWALYCMALKDKNPNIAQNYLDLWEKRKQEIATIEVRNKKQDRFNLVQIEGYLPTTDIGGM